MTQETLYKVLDEAGRPVHGGTGQWNLPHGKRPGKWMPPITGGLVECRNGYHLCRRDDLLVWLGPAIWIAEYRGDRLECNNKIVVRQARLLRHVDAWNEKTARLFACWCARQALSIWYKQYPKDDRVEHCIETAERYARGDVSREALRAGGAAADAAAWSSANVARDAPWPAWAPASAAQAVARAAAANAARHAAWGAVHAARDAAWAAWAAAWAAAGDAAWGAVHATETAAGAAAEDAAEDAARARQTARLMQMLGQEEKR